MGLGKLKKSWMMSLLQQKTLTAGVAVSKSLSMRKMARGDWSPLTDASSNFRGLNGHSPSKKLAAEGWLRIAS